MKVILLRDVAKVGQRGSVVEISDGYARNFLIPNSYAVQATPVKLAEHEAKKKKIGDEKAMKEKALATTVKSAENMRIELSLRATEKGGLFKAVTAAEIAAALLSQRRIMLPEETIHLATPIKTVGEHPIKIEASGAEAHVVVAITPKA